MSCESELQVTKSLLYTKLRNVFLVVLFSLLVSSYSNYKLQQQLEGLYIKVDMLHLSLERMNKTKDDGSATEKTN